MMTKQMREQPNNLERDCEIMMNALKETSMEGLYLVDDDPDNLFWSFMGLLNGTHQVEELDDDHHIGISSNA